MPTPRPSDAGISFKLPSITNLGCHIVKEPLYKPRMISTNAEHSELEALVLEPSWSPEKM